MMSETRTAHYCVGLMGTCPCEATVELRATLRLYNKDVVEVRGRDQDVSLFFCTDCAEKNLGNSVLLTVIADHIRVPSR